MFDIGRIHIEHTVSIMLLGGVSLGGEVGACQVFVLPSPFNGSARHVPLQTLDF